MGSMVILHRGARHWRGKRSKGRTNHSVSRPWSVWSALLAEWAGLDRVHTQAHHVNRLSPLYYEVAEFTTSRSMALHPNLQTSLL
jgi:hypothetical protein